MEARSERVHVAYTFLARLAPDSCARPVIINKIYSRELRRKFIKSALLVGEKMLPLVQVVVVQGPKTSFNLVVKHAVLHCHMAY